MPSLGSTEGNITGRKNKQTIKTHRLRAQMGSPSGGAAQIPVTSKRGLGREAQAPSLRLRIWPECPERYLSELIWASKPDCGIATTRKASPNLRHSQARAQNKGLNREPAADHPPPVTGSQSRKGAIAAPERHYLHNCKQASLLTKTSWGSGQSTSA